MDFIISDIVKYTEKLTCEEPSLLKELSKITYKSQDIPQMISGKVPGRLFNMLTKISSATRVLEIGMFTGYSTLCFAEALPQHGEVITCEIDPNVIEFARPFFDKSPHGKKIKVKPGPAMESLEKVEGLFDIAFIDADKKNYPNYYNLILPKMKKGGLILIDNCLWSGKVLAPDDEETKAIHSLNSLIQEDPRVENILLTIRDGIHLVRKN